MDDGFSSQSVINNEYDYSNLLITDEGVSSLVRYFDQLNKQLKKLTEEDELKNKQFKKEYKEYTFCKSYGQIFEVYIKLKNYGNNFSCDDYESFLSAVQGGKLKNILGLDIKLCMDFKRGKGDNLMEHKNSFVISLKPYDIKFIRKSNYKDSSMDQIEQQVNNIFKSFQVGNCIFCSK